MNAGTMASCSARPRSFSGSQGFQALTAQRRNQAGERKKEQRLVDVEPPCRAVRARQVVVQAPRHRQGRDGHDRPDRQPQQPVLSEGRGIEAARQHHRQQELDGVVERVRGAQGERARPEPSRGQAPCPVSARPSAPVCSCRAERGARA